MSKLSETTDFCVSDLSKPVRIVRDPTDRAEPISIPALLKRTAENYPNHTALMYKDVTTDEWKGISYKEYQDRVEKMAKIFIKLGLKPRQTVAILAFNSVEWFVAELAAIHAE